MYGNPRDYDTFSMLRARSKSLLEECYSAFINVTEDAIKTNTKAYWSFVNNRKAKKGISASRRKDMDAVMPPVSSMTFTLNNGNKLPAVGLGTYRVRQPDVIVQAVDEALAAGYRLFDTAAVYGNEGALGDAFRKLLPKYNLEREDI
ncbi:unnamed protein product, partial [Parnassius apollo]